MVMIITTMIPKIKRDVKGVVDKLLMERDNFLVCRSDCGDYVVSTVRAAWRDVSPRCPADPHSLL